MDRSTAYSFSRLLPLPYADAVAKTKEALKAEGFGILTEIDVKKTLREKLNLEFRDYVILGACNPPLAHRVLEAEPEVGVLLPCNVLVYTEGERTCVSAMNPEGAMDLVKNAAVAAIAAEVRRRLERVLDSL